MNFDDFNSEVIAWGKETEQALKSQASRLNIQHRSYSPSTGASVPKIRVQHSMKDGAVSRISVKFPRQLIWPHKGAGRGMGGIKGSRWINAAGEKKSTDPASFGKMGTGNRKEKPWLRNVMEGEGGVDHLATIAAEKIGDAITGNFMIN